MNKEDLILYKEKISKLSEQEQKQRDLYLKRIGPRPDISKYSKEELEEKEKIALKNIPEGAMIQGPTLNYPEIDKPWLQYYSDDAINETLPDETIVDYIWNCNKDNMDSYFAKYFNKNITYKELKENVEKVKSSLLSMGVKPFDGTKERVRISIALPTMPETFYLFLATLDLGCIATMIDPRINEERIKDCIVESKSEYVFFVDKFNDKFSNVCKELNMDKKFISISGAASLSKPMQVLYKLKNKIKNKKEFLLYKDFIKLGSNIDSKNIHGKYEAEAPAVLEFTSGTTSKPKGAFLSNKNLVGVAAQEKYAFSGKEPGDEFLNIMPPFITYGLVCGICATLSERLCLRLIPNFKPENFSKLLLKYKPQHVIGVPSFYEKLIQDPKIKNADLSFIKYCIAGGDKMPPTIEERINKFFKEHGIKNNIIKGYGMTELSSVAAVNLDNDSNKIGSTGIPFPKNSIKVVNPKTHENVMTNEIGELYEKGPTQMIGYNNNPELDKQLFIKDENDEVWVKTGDRGKVDEDGQIFIDGRYKNTIVRSDGHNVYPTPIENIIILHPAIVACSVIGIKNRNLESGEIPTACLVIKDEYKNNSNEIINQINQECLKKLPPRDIALDYKVVEEIPLTSVGKVDTNELKNMIEDNYVGSKVR